MKPYYDKDGITIYHGDCLEVLPQLEAESIDTVITDSPYGLEFMGKDWDHGVPGIQFWEAIMRVVKPGVFMLAFGGTRTYHRLTCAIEDAGWEVRDCIMWIYGSGFPKSANISKMLDNQEQKKWNDICKAVDNISKNDIIKAWTSYLKNVNNADVLSLKNKIEVGISTRKNDFVLENVVPNFNPKKLQLPALIAELKLNEVRVISEVPHTVRGDAGVDITLFPVRVKFAVKKLQNRKAIRKILQQENLIKDFFVQCNVKELQSVKTKEITKVEEALMIWLGSKKSLKEADINALCAEITNDLKHIILNQSKIFRNLDMSQKMVCVSVMNVTITESIMEHLISFTADMLKSKAIDKAAGAEREVVGTNEDRARRQPNSLDTVGRNSYQLAETPYIGNHNITAPATPAAAEWDGWGTALKPAYEPITVAMKPLPDTFAANALEYGVAGLWIDGARVEATDNVTRERDTNGGVSIFGTGKGGGAVVPTTQGRWPANVILSDDPEVLAGFPDVKTGGPGVTKKNTRMVTMSGGHKTRATIGYNFSGSAAHFFKVCSQDICCVLCDLYLSSKHSIMNEKEDSLCNANTAEKSLSQKKKGEGSVPLVVLQNKPQKREDKKERSNKNALGAEKALQNSTEINGNIVLKNAEDWRVGKIAQNVKSAACLCDRCAVSIAAALVKVKTSDFSQEELQVTLDYIGNYKSSILIQNLVSFAELWENIDTIPTTESLSILFGSVLHAIEDYIRQEEKEKAVAGNAQEKATRFRYIAKAGKAERGAYNDHPTVKPLALLRYLCKLTKTPTGGTIIDPFMGSGSLLLAAKLEGRPAIGIDQDEHSCEIAVRRIEEYLTDGYSEEIRTSKVAINKKLF